MTPIIEVKKICINSHSSDDSAKAIQRIRRIFPFLAPEHNTLNVLSFLTARWSIREFLIIYGDLKGLDARGEEIMDCLNRFFFLYFDIHKCLWEEVGDCT